MGIQHWGAFGGFQRKTGALVGHWTNGQNVITAIPHPSQNPPTVPQLNMRAKFRTVVAFSRRLTPLIRVGYQNAHKEKQSAFNAAFVDNYANAVTGIAPNYLIDYPNFAYSKGQLSNGYNAEVVTAIADTVQFTWLATLATGIGGPTDMATLVVYNPVKNQLVTLVGAAARSALTYSMLVPGDFSGDDVHCWISFVSANGKMASDSFYVGEFTVV
ncbi:DUF6266 family protein [Pedobacter heparinus]|uniref:DUF6266 family protein n=1 Tax=Pedobacter heparinus TaxID=984 RepID=UPI002930949D|nr:DUF6266 family protein [Pedobacter heparinus]